MVPYASFLIPAKNFAVFGVKFAIAIYPRKGTETFPGTPPGPGPDCNLSP